MTDKAVEEPWQPKGIKKAEFIVRIDGDLGWLSVL